jgi:hypothetical protein
MATVQNAKERHVSETNVQDVPHRSFIVQYVINTPYSRNITSCINPLQVTLIQKWLIFNDIPEKDDFQTS